MFSISPNDSLLHEYTGNEQSFFNGRGGGLYLVQVLPEENTTIQIHASKLDGGEELLNISDLRIKNRLKVEKNFNVNPPRVRLILPPL